MCNVFCIISHSKGWVIPSGFSHCHSSPDTGLMPVKSSIASRQETNNISSPVATYLAAVGVERGRRLQVKTPAALGEWRSPDFRFDHQKMFQKEGHLKYVERKKKRNWLFSPLYSWNSPPKSLKSIVKNCATLLCRVVWSSHCSAVT